MVALPDRAALAATLAPVTGPARTSMVAATLAACAFLTQLLDAAAPDAGNRPDTALDTPVGRAMQIAGRAYLSQAQDGYRMLQPIDDERAAMLTVLLDLPGMREFAARQTSPEEWQIQMWSDLVRRAETAFTATPATLLALSAMQAGHGTLASIAIGRALACEPDNRLAQLLAQAIAAGIEPATVTAMLAG